MLIPFIGYSLGRRYIGYVECEGERLTDLLNRLESVVIREAFVESFEDDTVTNLGDGEVDRSTLYVVEASGDRGEGARRIHTVRHRLQVQLGPYTALGLLHALPGQMPLPYLHSRGPMIPLSDATLAFTSRSTMNLKDVGTLIVNRDLLDWVRASEDDAMAFPGVPVLTDRV
ncbi:MAG: hypothetical protein ABSE70_09530 [Candidatus Limnocylindrales bacterium]